MAQRRRHTTGGGGFGSSFSSVDVTPPVTNGEAAWHSETNEHGLRAAYSRAMSNILQGKDEDDEGSRATLELALRPARILATEGKYSQALSVIKSLSGTLDDASHHVDASDNVVALEATDREILEAVLLQLSVLSVSCCAYEHIDAL